MTDSDFSEIQTDDASDQEFSWPDSSEMGPPAAAGLSPQTWPSSGSYRPRSTSAGSALTSAAIAPVPQARQVPVIQLPHTFEEPRKRISSVMDIDKFQQSETSGKLFLGFVVALSEAIKGHKISDACREGRIVKLLVGILEKMSKWIDDIPPRQQAARYGNPAFRDWHAQLNHQGPALIQEILPEELHPAVVEVFPYFADSFGNSSRIDYGTGHEANFAAFLLCLARLGLVDEGDYQALVARVFVTYLDLMRKLQMTYWLEPAGSHGVWGLDDYHFLPFIFGAAQLTDHKYMKPKSVHNQDILDNFSKEYLYLGCVDFVKKVKKGPLAEHSPMIDDISGVASWNKVHGGMLKMYKVEVLEKVPIMQHFLFGSLIRW